MNLNGQTIVEQRNINSEMVHINTKNLESGVYLIHLHADNETCTEKLIITK